MAVLHLARGVRQRTGGWGAPELKEFDGVVTVEGIYSSKLLDARRTDEARRLLRVAITRVRRTVVFVRPAEPACGRESG
ncbi:hypothetical protein OG223_53100 [Streptomyces sp. NBC_01478]|uniref:hypothetical protein n=1 Tax=Streptomyces sp. NBC_01478 TaxID=2903882 RepID=UPI002E325316|nr:hypothetical protein [Streptomyces sp. NBC_01478]